jgi:deazaflavin-dependent oxidoreductase (nitroreductase family)
MVWDRMRRAPREAVQRLGRTALGVRLIGRVVSPLQRRLYLLSGGRISLTGRAPVLLLTTTGRRTGLERTVPLFYTADGDRFIVCNVNPGFEGRNPWTLNLRAEPRARVQLHGAAFDVRARPASAEETDRYWPRLTRIWPAYQTFYDEGGERSIFVLEPVNP